jgi:sodium-dependent dicarboxylate transporter 2/3/5
MLSPFFFRIKGFSTWLVQYLIALRGLPVWVINLIVSIIAATMTEVVSNTATANVLLPILWEMSLTLCQNPTYLGESPFQTKI